MLKHWRSVERLLPLLFFIMIILAGCQPSAIDPIGKVAKMEGSLMALSLAIMLLVICVVFIVFFVAVFRFRKRKGEEIRIPRQVEGNMKLEILWTVIPILLLAILVVPTVIQVFVLSDDRSSASGKKEMTIKVTAHQYWWEYEYPDQKIKTASDLYVPTNTRINIELTSDDVIHSFWVPSLFGKTDANPGLTSKFWFDSPSNPGVFDGECAELCGPSHALMDFKVVTLSPSQFKKWEGQMKAGEVKPTSDLAAKGKEIFDKTCIGCHAVGYVKGNENGPNVAGFADRQSIAGILDFNKQNLKNWIHDAPSIKEDIIMPSFKTGSNQLSDQQVDALVAYLLDQKTGIVNPPK